MDLAALRTGPVGQDCPDMTPEAIVRVFRARVSAEEWSALRPVLAGHVVRYAATWRTVFAHWIGSATAGTDVDAVVVTGFENAALLEAASASAAAVQSRQGLLGGVIARGHAEDYALVDQFASSFAPGAASALQLIECSVPDADVAAVLSRAARAREALYASGDLAVTQTLRRGTLDGTRLLFVCLFRDAAAVARWSGPGSPVAVATDAGLAPSLRVSTYDLEPISALRLAPDGPAILITDDGGSVVDATPAAVTLLGRDVWRVLGVTLAELGIGADGPSRVARPEGGHALVHVRGLRDLPAPGRHATLLVAGSSPVPSEADAADAVRLAYRRSHPEDRPSEQSPAVPG